MDITSTLSHFTVDLSRFLESLSSRNYLPFLLVSTVSLNSPQLANHVSENEQSKQWFICNIYPTLSTRTNNTRCPTHHLASSYISSPREEAPLSPRKIPTSVSLLDSVWQNLRDSIVLESMLSSKGQFASSKLSINRDTWTTPKSAAMI